MVGVTVLRGAGEVVGQDELECHVVMGRGPEHDQRPVPAEVPQDVCGDVAEHRCGPGEIPPARVGLSPGEADAGDDGHTGGDEQRPPDVGRQRDANTGVLAPHQFAEEHVDQRRQDHQL